MDVQHIKRIYFIGIGGIGMSALARYYHARNTTVSGYDKTRSALTLEMEDAGIRIHYEDNVALLDRNAELVVYTPAVPADHLELNYYLHHGYEVVKRSVLLGRITAPTFNICIAGTHGKTTISTLVAHILRYSGIGCNAFLGGISVNYGTNFWGGDERVSVAEADEYDRSFLQLSPDLAVISAMDADHLDIYGTRENMEAAFVLFAERLRPEGMLFIHYALAEEPFAGIRRQRYTTSDAQADVSGTNVRLSDGGYTFDVQGTGWTLEGVRLNLGGMHNVENAVAAIAVAQRMAVPPEKIRAAVDAFRGVKRRFEYVIPPTEAGHAVFIDDYAHHPQELEALITGARALFPGRRCTVIFQPHLYSRTRDLADGFGRSLELADEVFLLPVYPAREQPIPGVTSDMIAAKMTRGNVRVCSTEECLAHFRAQPAPELLITAGAGDIDQLVEPLRQVLNEKNR